MKWALLKRLWSGIVSMSVILYMIVLVGAFMVEYKGFQLTGLFIFIISLGGRLLVYLSFSSFSSFIVFFVDLTV